MRDKAMLSYDEVCEMYRYYREDREDIGCSEGVFNIIKTQADTKNWAACFYLSHIYTSPSFFQIKTPPYKACLPEKSKGLAHKYLVDAFKFSQSNMLMQFIFHELNSPYLNERVLSAVIESDNEFYISILIHNAYNKSIAGKNILDLLKKNISPTKPNVCKYLINILRDEVFGAKYDCDLVRDLCLQLIQSNENRVKPWFHEYIKTFSGDYDHAAKVIFILLIRRTLPENICLAGINIIKDLFAISRNIETNIIISLASGEQMLISEAYQMHPENFLTELDYFVTKYFEQLPAEFLRSSCDFLIETLNLLESKSGYFAAKKPQYEISGLLADILAEGRPAAAESENINPQAISSLKTRLLEMSAAQNQIILGRA